MTVMSERIVSRTTEDGTISMRPADPILADSKLWAIVSGGDLKGLSPEQKTQYYLYRCRQMGLDPSTQPFTYITFQGKGVLYANKTAADQLRKVHGISIESVQYDDDGEYITYEVTVRDKTGRADHEVGVVYVGGLRGEPRANARMKAMTKAKRRATYSICGAGMLDETEIEGVPWTADDGRKMPSGPAWSSVGEPLEDYIPDAVNLFAMTKNELGAHIKELRERLGWTADELRQDAAIKGRTLATKQGAIETALMLQRFILESESGAQDEPSEEIDPEPYPGSQDASQATDDVQEGIFKDIGVPGFAGNDQWTNS